jgi:hypothetical protein
MLRNADLVYRSDSQSAWALGLYRRYAEDEHIIGNGQERKQAERIECFHGEPPLR